MVSATRGIMQPRFCLKKKAELLNRAVAIVRRGCVPVSATVLLGGMGELMSAWMDGWMDGWIKQVSGVN